jgi:hypothetical protein
MKKTEIGKWMNFIFNFPPNFIECIWKDDPSLVEHFKGRFKAYYEKYGPYGVIPAFYGQLTRDNQIKMEEWVLKYFKD